MMWLGMTPKAMAKNAASPDALLAEIGEADPHRADAFHHFEANVKAQPVAA